MSAEPQADNRLAHFRRADFIQLINLAQNQFLLFFIDNAVTGQQPPQNLPITEMNRKFPDLQLLENLHDDRGNFGVISGA